MELGQVIRKYRKEQGMTQEAVSYTHLDVYKRQALSIAKAVGAGFVRIPVFVDTVVAFCGVIGPAAPMAVKLRSRLQAGEVQILADVQVKYTKMLLPATTIEESAKMAQSCGADAIIVTGVSSGDVPPIDAVKRVKQAVAAPVLIGSGIARENVREQLAIADGAIVGLSLIHI